MNREKNKIEDGGRNSSFKNPRIRIKKQNPYLGQSQQEMSLDNVLMPHEIQAAKPAFENFLSLASNYAQ